MKLLSTLLLFSFFQCSFATTYYISPQGSDENGNGSISNPWQTLYRATTAVVTPGSIIHVSAGTYNEILQSTLAVGVSIEGDGVTSVLKSALTADWKEMLSLHSPEGTNGNQHISNLKFDGQNLLTFWGIYVAGRSNVSIHDITMEDFKDKGVLFAGRNDNLEAPPSIYATGNTFYNNTVSNCAAYNTANGIYGRGCLCIGGQDGMLIYNNKISQNSRREGYNGWPIKYENGGYLNGCKIYNNILSKIPMGNSFGVTGWDFAIELFNESGLEIYGNTIQGSIDLNIQTKGNYAYSAWIHNNTIGQPILNRYIETAITLEFGTEAAIVENNQINNVGIPVCFTPREGNTINNMTIANNRCENIGVADKSHQGFAIRIGSDGNGMYLITNLFIYKNKFIAGNIENPYWGIGILGALKATNIQIRDNSINNFSAGCIVASPASIIDTMIVENNIFSRNGYANKPSFSDGIPKNYTYKNNTANNAVVFSFINIKMNIVRPFYYAIKSTSVLVFIAVLAAIFSLLFSAKENIYVYPIGLISMFLHFLLSFDQGFIGDVCIIFCYMLMGIYGWVLWSKRDRRKHRIIRITSSSKKEWLTHLAFLGVIFLLVFFCMSYQKEYFTQGTISWADAFAVAGTFLALWLMAKKKIESWYWWIMTNSVSILLYFTKNYIFMSVCYLALLFMAIWGLYCWKKRRRFKRR